LPEEILIELYGGFRVAAKRKLNAGIEDKAGVSEMQYRRGAHVEYGVIAVMAKNGQCAGDRYGAAIIAFAYKRVDRAEVVEVVVN
jgi:hypothetical protein